jgi:hypothetical protein
MTKKQVQSALTNFKKTGINLQDDKATNWLASNLSKIKTTMKQDNFIDAKKKVIRKSMTPGKMVFYGYIPKTKDVLQFWDEFPVVIILHEQPGGFLGLNLHYLPPSKRANFLNSLLTFVTDPKWALNNNTNVEFALSYGLLKTTSKLKDFKPCIKRYYYKHIITKVAYIEPVEWKTIPFFPLDKFKGASRADVWSLA